MKIFLCILLSVLSLNAIAVESDISCETTRDILDRIENVTEFTFKHHCKVVDETDLVFIYFATYEHDIEVNFGDLKPTENEFIDEYVMFDKRVVTGGYPYMNLIEDAINDSLGKKNALQFAIYRTDKPQNKDYQGVYILKEFLK